MPECGGGGGFIRDLGGDMARMTAGMVSPRGVFNGNMIGVAPSRVRGTDLDRDPIGGDVPSVSCKSISSKKRKSSNSCNNPSILASARCILAVARSSSGDDDVCVGGSGDNNTERRWDVDRFVVVGCDCR